MSKVRTDFEMGPEQRIRIGELARRAGVPTATLRAWERRYAVVTPVRGESGYRLYSETDERRLRAMVALTSQGVAPAEAAGMVRDMTAFPEPPPAVAGSGFQDELLTALLGFDNPAAEGTLDRALSAYSVDAFVVELIMPVLHEIGERWTRGEVSIGQEHFASNVLRGRMFGLARGWGGGDGEKALLACPPGEYHDLGLIGFGVALFVRGWRVTFLGADTPIESIRACAEELEPDLVVVCSMSEPVLEAVETDLIRLSSSTRLELAGAGARAGIADRLGLGLLPDDPVLAAESLAA